MNKKLAFALPLAIGFPFAVNAATVSISADDGPTSKAVSDTGNNTLDNIRTGASATIQASAGVRMQLEDGSFSDPDVGGNDIAVTSCHEGGNAAYFGETGGGSVLKNANFGTNQCDNASNLGWGTVANT